MIIIRFLLLFYILIEECEQFDKLLRMNLNRQPIVNIRILRELQNEEDDKTVNEITGNIYNNSNSYGSKHLHDRFEIEPRKHYEEKRVHDNNNALINENINGIENKEIDKFSHENTKEKLPSDNHNHAMSKDTTEEINEENNKRNDEHNMILKTKNIRKLKTEKEDSKEKKDNKEKEYKDKDHKEKEENEKKKDSQEQENREREDSRKGEDSIERENHKENENQKEIKDNKKQKDNIKKENRENEENKDNTEKENKEREDSRKGEDSIERENHKENENHKEIEDNKQQKDNIKKENRENEDNKEKENEENKDNIEQENKEREDNKENGEQEEDELIADNYSNSGGVQSEYGNMNNELIHSNEKHENVENKYPFYKMESNEPIKIKNEENNKYPFYASESSGPTEKKEKRKIEDIRNAKIRIKVHNEKKNDDIYNKKNMKKHSDNKNTEKGKKKESDNNLYFNEKYQIIQKNILFKDLLLNINDLLLEQRRFFLNFLSFIYDNYLNYDQNCQEDNMNCQQNKLEKNNNNEKFEKKSTKEKKTGRRNRKKKGHTSNLTIVPSSFLNLQSDMKKLNPNSLVSTNNIPNGLKENTYIVYSSNLSQKDTNDTSKRGTHEMISKGNQSGKDEQNSYKVETGNGENGKNFVHNDVEIVLRYLNKIKESESMSESQKEYLSIIKDLLELEDSLLDKEKKTKEFNEKIIKLLIKKSNELKQFASEINNDNYNDHNKNVKDFPNSGRLDLAENFVSNILRFSMNLKNTGNIILNNITDHGTLIQNIEKNLAHGKNEMGKTNKDLLKKKIVYNNDNQKTKVEEIYRIKSAISENPTELIKKQYEVANINLNPDDKKQNKINCIAKMLSCSDKNPNYLSHMFSSSNKINRLILKTTKKYFLQEMIRKAETLKKLYKKLFDLLK